MIQSGGNALRMTHRSPDFTEGMANRRSSVTPGHEKRDGKRTDEDRIYVD
jgi:hypothetical protein